MPKKKEEPDRIQIRSSSLGALASCPRHFAANREREFLAVAHPDVMAKRKPGAFKTFFGTAFHKLMEDNVKSPKKIREVSQEVLGKPSEEDDMFFDDKFTQIEQMQVALENMVNAFRKSEHSAEWTIKRNGNKYEQALDSKEIDSGILLTGHIDCVRKDGMALDLKTGMTTDANLYQEQLTAYRLLVEHSGRKTPPFAEVVKVSRPMSPRTKVPVTSKRYRVDTRVHESRVIRLVKEAADIVTYRERWIEDFTKLPANPSSKACMYCELKNTSACPETQRIEV